MVICVVCDRLNIDHLWQSGETAYMSRNMLRKTLNQYVPPTMYKTSSFKKKWQNFVFLFANYDKF